MAEDTEKEEVQTKKGKDNICCFSVHLESANQ